MARWKANERDRTPKRRAEVLERREKKKEARKEAQALKALSAMNMDDEEAVSSFCLSVYPLKSRPLSQIREVFYSNTDPINSFSQKHSRTKRRFIEIRKRRDANLPIDPLDDAFRDAVVEARDAPHLFLSRERYIELWLKKEEGGEHFWKGGVKKTGPILKAIKEKGGKLRSELVGEMKERQRLKENETGDDSENDSVYDRGEGIDAKQGLLDVVEGRQELEVDVDREDAENSLPDEVSQLLARL
ncbi:MAG: hypothetical protein M1836_002794 [Candelina mexicana]|nr:MAG: hypothetical protein M1836_002794 [Candelina mexicana]